MHNGYVSVRVYRKVLVFAASAGFLAGIVLFLTGHQLGGALALGFSVAASVLLFVSSAGSNNRQIDDEEAEAGRKRNERKPPAKPKQPPNYKDLN